MKLQITSTIAILFLMILMGACNKEPTCSDGEQNQGELGIDCCGPCTPCPTLPSCNPLVPPLQPSCSDGVQNQNETGVDCGGVCPPCSTTADPTCTDGIQNGDETGVDCGGSCSPCTTEPSCTDGIQNGDETGVDCGGSCDPCQGENAGTMQGLVDGNLWTASSVGVQNPDSQTIIITGTDAAGATVEITYVGAFEPGAYAIASAITATTSLPNEETCTATAGTLVITTFDTSAQTITGGFDFGCSTAGGSSQTITEGQFDVSY